jgi:hypothetical protein
MGVLAPRRGKGMVGGTLSSCRGELSGESLPRLSLANVFVGKTSLPVVLVSDPSGLGRSASPVFGLALRLRLRQDDDRLGWGARLRTKSILHGRPLGIRMCRRCGRRAGRHAREAECEQGSHCRSYEHEFLFPGFIYFSRGIGPGHCSTPVYQKQSNAETRGAEPWTARRRSTPAPEGQEVTIVRCRTCDGTGVDQTSSRPAADPDPDPDPDPEPPMETCPDATCGTREITPQACCMLCSPSNTE